MKYFLQRLEDDLKGEIARILGVATEKLVVEQANPKFGADFAAPFFSLAKELSKSPQDIAEIVRNELTNEAIDKLDVASGYLNIWLKPEVLANGLATDLSGGQEYGNSDEGAGKTVVVDFIGLNLSKPFSVGHLRPTVQGAALINLYRTLGYEVIGDSHLGDWGTPFGMWVVGYEKWGSEEALAKDGAYELGRLYVKFREESEKDEALIDEAKAWLKKLEEGDSTAIEYKDRFSKISLDHMNTVLERLDVKADENLGESFYIEESKKLVEQLITDGVAIKQEDGSVIVSLEDHGIDTPILLQKSDGSLLYATTDVQTIRYRKEMWDPVKIIYSVGGEQQFHFRQVFALADKLGYQMELAHPWFGTVDEIDEDGKRSKMSSRKSTALLENLLEKAEEKAQEVTKEDISPEDQAKIAVGAIKFNDFAQSRQTNILFDWDRMFSLSGYSSVYVQYAVVRVNSIFSSQNIERTQSIEGLEYDWQAEKPLLSILAQYPDVVKAAAHEYEPSKVASFSYELAKAWNKYYENYSIKDSEGDTRQARSWLAGNVASTLTNSLALLGIEIPEKM